MPKSVKSGFEHAHCLAVAEVEIVGHIHLSKVAGHGMMQLGDDGKNLHLEQHSLMPIAFDFHAQVAFGVLIHFHPTRVVAKAPQIGVEPSGQIVALAAHKFFFFVSEAQILEIFYLALEFFAKSGWIFSPVAVHKLIFHHGAWKTVYYSAAHGEFIEVGVGEMSYYRSHCIYGIC